MDKVDYKCVEATFMENSSQDDTFSDWDEELTQKITSHSSEVEAGQCSGESEFLFSSEDDDELISQLDMCDAKQGDSKEVKENICDENWPPCTQSGMLSSGDDEILKHSDHLPVPDQHQNATKNDTVDHDSSFSDWDEGFTQNVVNVLDKESEQMKHDSDSDPMIATKNIEQQNPSFVSPPRKRTNPEFVSPLRRKLERVNLEKDRFHSPDK